MIGSALARAGNHGVGHQRKYDWPAVCATQGSLERRRGGGQQHIRAISYRSVNHCAERGHVALRVADTQLKVATALQSGPLKADKKAIAVDLHVGRFDAFEEVDFRLARKRCEVRRCPGGRVSRGNTRRSACSLGDDRLWKF